MPRSALRFAALAPAAMASSLAVAATATASASSASVDDGPISHGCPAQIRP